MLQELFGVAGLAFGIVGLNWYGAKYSFERSIEAAVLVGSAAIPMILLEGLVLSLGGRGFGGTRDDHPSLDGNDRSSSMMHVFAMRLIGMVATFGAIALTYWYMNDYHSSFLSGVFGIDDRHIHEGNASRETHDVPLYHNYFRLAGVFYQDLCGRSVYKVIGLMMIYLMVSQFYLDQPCDGFWATGQIVVSPIKGLIQILRNSEGTLLLLFRVSFIDMI